MIIKLIVPKQKFVYLLDASYVSTYIFRSDRCALLPCLSPQFECYFLLSCNGQSKRVFTRPVTFQKVREHFNQLRKTKRLFLTSTVQNLELSAQTDFRVMGSLFWVNEQKKKAHRHFSGFHQSCVFEQLFQYWV